MNRPLLAALLLLTLTACSRGQTENATAAPNGPTKNATAVTRTYYIAADEVMWDYAPSGANLTEGRPFQGVEKALMEAGPTVIGRKVKKALFREYTDATFTTLKTRTPAWEHLGFLGPLIRAEVGDTVIVVLKNNAKFPASVHPHGVFYKKDSEGAPYNDNSTDKKDDGVQPGDTYKYVWEVPERAGPADHEGSSILWMYHSHVEETRDVQTGLLGPMIITRRGMARPDGSPTDVDREIVGGFVEVDENASWYVEDNIKANATKPNSVKVIDGFPGTFGLAATPDFDKYFRETINGYSYGHTPGLTMKAGQRVRWYLMASTGFEIHSPHWHGNVVTVNHMRTDVGQLVSMGMFVADMVPDNPGKWLFHCHVGAHLKMGMQATYMVE